MSRLCRWRTRGPCRVTTSLSFSQIHRLVSACPFCTWSSHANRSFSLSAPSASANNRTCNRASKMRRSSSRWPFQEPCKRGQMSAIAHKTMSKSRVSRTSVAVRPRTPWRRTSSSKCSPRAPSTASSMPSGAGCRCPSRICRSRCLGPIGRQQTSRTIWRYGRSLTVNKRRAQLSRLKASRRSQACRPSCRNPWPRR